MSRGSNKATERTRRAIASVAECRAEKFVQWLDEVAEGSEVKGVKADPKAAAEIYLKAIEYHIPKLARTEVTGEDGGPVVQRIERVVIK